MDINSDGEPKRSQFGNRYLTDPTNVFEHNAWDNVQWDEEQEEEAKRTVANNSCVRLGPEAQSLYESEGSKYWNNFYGQHQNKFFKDRHWLFTEFPELAPIVTTESCHTLDASAVGFDQASEEVEKSDIGNLSGSANSELTIKKTEPEKLSDIWVAKEFPGRSAKTRMFEVGCGVGNTVFPVLKTNNDPSLFMYCCDLSENAIQLIKESKEYCPDRCHAFVFDVTDSNAELPFPPSSMDFVILIFILSAVNPEKMSYVISRLVDSLKPGGLLLFRDYGRYDLTQLRFKKGKCLGDNFYVRGDGTKVYFFTQDELRDMFTKAGLVEEQNLIDRRLQVNRSRQLKMYRIWIQCKYRKPVSVITAADPEQLHRTKFQ